ncbi:MAG: hypothetical protein K2J30_00670, partial [Clostridia bacterium]|nr:hypothetical protein [Clostridia bacterium]
MSFFRFDNLNGEFPALGTDIRRGVPAAVFGVSDAEKYLIASLVEGRTVYIAADALAARRAHAAISALSGKKCTLLCAKDEVLTYRKAGSKDSLYRRLTALYEWQEGAEVLVTDIEAVVQLVPCKLKVFKLKAGHETDMRSLVEALVQVGYTREYTVDGKGAFSVRGDILDIYPINSEHPVRIDFFGDEVESIKPYDEVTGERYPLLSSLDIVAATDALLEEGEETALKKALIAELSHVKNAEAYARAQAVISDLEANGFRSDFLMPLLANTCSFFSVADGETLFVFDECKQIKDKFDGLYKEHWERLAMLREKGEAFSFSGEQYLPSEEVSFTGRRALSLASFIGQTYFFSPMKSYSFTSAPVHRYLNNLPELFTDLRNWGKTGYRVMLWCGTPERAQKMREELLDNYFPVVELPERLEKLNGIAVLEGELANGFLLHGCKLAVIGTQELYTKAAAPRRIKKRSGDLFLAPEVGDYAVNE